LSKTKFLLPFESDLVGFGAIIHEGLLEPWVLKRLLGSDAFLGVVDEDLLEKIEELSVEFRMREDTFLPSISINRGYGQFATYVELFHRFDILLRALLRLGVGVVKFVVLEISCRTAKG
jgi:hypothetical protein